MNAVQNSLPVWNVVRNPNVCGGEPIIEGTRIPVSSIVSLWLAYRDYDRVRSAFPRLDRDAIDCALVYYQLHQPEIDRLITDAAREAYATQ
ncbi:MAG TPA: DUF433 domain-containing protein [Chloroflexota bacterium]|nr:DUF433 domain-containing protein [Chloroflexota bacterium]